ncbi:MAG: PilW family protein [Wenzhouxiangella sp.]|jgi:type IV pilus assembly protein PilW|nr:PilW family protein [Wenzhouxiangella sp.]
MTDYPKAMRNIPHKSSGLTLIELMVALTLGLLLLGGVLQLFVGSRVTYTTNEALARVQENVRFSSEELKRVVRGASHFGFCGMRPEPEVHLDLPGGGWIDAVFNETNGIIGWEALDTGIAQSVTIDTSYPIGSLNQWAAAPRQVSGLTPTLDLPDVLTDRVVADTDVLIVRELIPIPGVSTTGTVDPSLNELTLDADPGLAEDALVLITDCNDADLFRNQGSGTTLSRATGSSCGSCPTNLSPVGREWSTVSTQVVQLYRVQISAYYIGFNDNREEPGLYRMDLSGCPCGAQPEELISGVENLQALYGYSLPSTQGGDGKSVDPGRWLTADQINDWWPVIGVRIALLHRSPDGAGLGAGEVAYELVGTRVVSPSDGILRQGSASTIAMRNRVMYDD